MTREQLKDAAENLIDVMDLKDGPEGKKKRVEISDEMESEDIVTFIKQVIPWIEDGDAFENETIEVLDIVEGRIKDPNPEKPKKIKVDKKDSSVINKPLAEMSLEEEIASTEDLKALKDIALSEPQFKAIRGRLASFEDVDSLREEMTWLFTNAKVPSKEPEQLEIPEKEIIVEQEMEVVEKKGRKKKLIEAPVEKEIVIPEDSYPKGKLVMLCDAIKTRKPFNNLFEIRDTTLNAIIKNMEKSGYDVAFPIILWNDTVIDGHTRLKAAQAAGLTEVPVEQKEFSDEKEALEYAIHNQRDRRNITDAEILHCVEAIDKPVEKKVASAKGGVSKKEEKTEKVKTHKETAKKLNIGESKVLDARTVLADEEAKEAVETGKKSLSKAAKEVREKKSVGKPKKEKRIAESSEKTIIDATVEVLRKHKGQSVNITDLLDETAKLCDTWGISDELDETKKDFDITVIVCQALGLVRFDKADIVIGKKI